MSEGKSTLTLAALGMLGLVATGGIVGFYFVDRERTLKAYRDWCEHSGGGPREAWMAAVGWQRSRPLSRRGARCIPAADLAYEEMLKGLVLIYAKEMPRCPPVGLAAFAISTIAKHMPTLHRAYHFRPQEQDPPWRKPKPSSEKKEATP